MNPTTISRALRLVVLAALLPMALPAQLAHRGTIPVASPDHAAFATALPGAYGGGRLHRTLFGSGYRDLWQTPITVEVLDLGRFAGGLTPTRTGGDFSTRSLHFRGADGREYVFRSLDKDATQGLHPDLRNTLTDGIVQDQVSVVPPTGVLVASALQSAAGILHAPPRLVLLQRDTRLGEHIGEFGGMLGTIEERPGDADEGPAFAGAARVASTETLLQRLDGDARHRVDSRAYLAARLVDLLIGDWDRHAGQWRWARYDQDGAYLWKPVARDRDNAFARHGGWVLAAARTEMPKLVRFGSTYPALFGLTESAQTLDRRILSDLPRQAWDSVAFALVTALTDDVIDEAVLRLPPEHHAIVGAGMAAALRARRDALPQVANAFYLQLAAVVDVHGTDGAETVEVERVADGGLQVRVFAADGPPLFRRGFAVGETREVRLHLGAGNDQVQVAGEAAESPLLRVIGGAGDDVLVDASRTAGGRRTVFHDSEGDDRVETGLGAVVDGRPYTPPSAATRIDNLPAPRDRGSAQSFAPFVGFGEAGVLVGGEATRTRYGFRRDPFASRDRLRLEMAPREAGLALDYLRIGHTSGGSTLVVHARASQVDAFRFHGYGNDTGASAARDEYVVQQDAVVIEAELSRPVAPRLRLALGPILQYRDASANAETPYALAAGDGSYGTAGLAAALRWDRRDNAAFPTRGAWASLAGEAHQGLGGQAGEAFARARAEGGAYLPVQGAATLAVRAGGERVWGAFPVQEAAFLGGQGSLRALPRGRLAGDASLWSSAELRAGLGRANLRVARGDAGALLLADAGRVFVDGESRGGWHTGYGGGVYFSALDHAYTATLLAARGDAGWRAYLRMGLPF
ncbi:MAG TPA: BamA/TamA family outer membrane protein [Longimicrobium sp.]|nr:BamA/TamA family outer membrane protein [Longimicrobium sp.]